MQDVGHITLGIGGSATTDGGRGLLEALDRAGSGRASVSTTSTLVVACDVYNPLLGIGGGSLDLRPAEGRHARAGPRARRAKRALGRRARSARQVVANATRRARARPVASGSRCWRSRTDSSLRPSTRRRPRSWRRPTSTPSSRARTSSSPARAGSTLRPRSARPRSASARRAQAAGVAVHRGRWWRRARRRRGARGHRSGRRARDRAPADRRGRDGRGTAPLERCGERLARLVCIGATGGAR